MISIRIFAALVLVLAFGAGALVADCGACCAPRPATAVTVSAPGCCGCDAALELPAAPDSLSAGQSTPVPAPAMARIDRAVADEPRAGRPPSLESVRRLFPSPPSRSTPARL